MFSSKLFPFIGKEEKEKRKGRGRGVHQKTWMIDC